MAKKSTMSCKINFVSRIFIQTVQRISSTMRNATAEIHPEYITPRETTFDTPGEGRNQGFMSHLRKNITKSPNIIKYYTD